MSESGDYDPGEWRGHDFGSARAQYDEHAGRSYERARTEQKTLRDLVPKSVIMNSTWPLIIDVDTTDSMQDKPAVIFSKMPYLDKEGQEYMGNDLEICFMANGDANSGYRDNADIEDYPVQVRPAAKGLKLKDSIAELIQERKGGGQMRETYELNALYCLRKIQTPNAIRKPLFIIIGDEKTYDDIDPETAERVLGIKLKSKLRTEDLFRELKERFAVYHIHSEYDPRGTDKMSPLDKQIYDHWVDLLDADHVSVLYETGRIVDVIFGIMAKETERIAYFEEELEGRQTAEQVRTVYKSLQTIHAVKDPARGATKVHGTKSVIRGAKPANLNETTKPLL